MSEQTQEQEIRDTEYLRSLTYRELIDEAGRRLLRFFEDNRPSVALENSYERAATEILRRMKIKNKPPKK